MTDNFRNTVLYLFLFLTLVSCQDLKKTEKPDDLIPEDKMVDVLTELALVNAARNYSKPKLESTGINPDEYIYEKFNIDSLQFERSNDYYTEKYDQYERIYDSVKVRLQIIKTRLDSLREIEVRIEDSIKLARKDSLRELDSLEVDSLKLDSIKSLKKDNLIQDKDSLNAPPVKFDSESNNRRD
ncbi:DUF4296 domain-containing protein [Gramella sp. MT6]|uniref:DUF4296 domain-containing protein n=1 Tax=Gramella sp. MT6 TaxID=2705471 RepID=UPI001C60805E|nr:DUF4296 domain-containing protein [Gramella sp. MT6]QYA24439.1 DUF4296 domain-containing protein [Gramella sp. MT6]